MKLTKTTSALLALASAAIISTTAHAQINYNEGDLILGFEQGNGSGGVTANNYVVDLGAVSQFINARSTLTFNLSASDLTSAFGSSWASNASLTTGVKWGLIGGSDTDGPITVGGVTLQKNTLFYSKGELVVGTPSTAPTTASSSTQGNINGNIQNFGLDILGQGTGNAAITASSDSLGWSGNTPSTGAFGGAGNIEQPASGLYTGPTNSVLDLWQLNNTTTTPGAVAKDLGTFSLDSSGVFTFSPVAAVPEPSSFALGLVGMALMAVLIRRKRKGLSVE